MLRNTEDSYGLVAIVIHWLMAVVLIGLFILGLWMVELDYYSKWYQTGPDIHRSVGILLFFVLLFRIAFRLLNPSPKPEPNITHWQHLAAVAMHWLLLLLILLISVSGYLISTADGRAVDVFGWFNIPATVTSIDNQEDIAGQVHYYLSVAILVLAGIHALAALKHHFIDKDATLIRILGIRRKSSQAFDQND